MPRKKSINHEKIVEAAKKEFGRYSFKEASMRNIAAEAGMSASGLYKHFPSKEEMFANLVEPVKEEFEREYRERERREYAELGNGDAKILSEQTGGNRWAMGFIYDHIEEFRLLIIKSEGTVYENYIHDVAMLEETSTLAFISELRKRGESPIDLPRKEVHLLVTAQVNAVFEAVKHGFSKEEALHYADTLDAFFMPGWLNVMCVPAENATKNVG
ncbi:MAG: TetR/AcrR family transcriptional regulator [Lachnospiraceae bacterium]|nr:TetR/AcrR family transcriptional regulator [Lachnospiraceae bacterium]